MMRARPLSRTAHHRWFILALLIGGVPVACVVGQPSPATRPAAATTTAAVTQPANLTPGSIVPAAPDLIVDAPQTPAASMPAGPIQHVLIISVDGMRPDCMLRAATPTLRSLMDHGSFTMYARTTDWAITSPSHVSMLTGVTPEVHGITSNVDPKPGDQIKVPSIFDLAKASGLSTGLASGKKKFEIFEHSGHVDFGWITPAEVGPDAPVAEHAADIVREHKPSVMFVHFAGADVNGHGRGWGTTEQLAALAEIDTGIGKVLAAYDEAGLRDQTLVIVSADHGGSGQTHGTDDPRSRYIPWIASGPGVRQNFDLTRLGTGYDIATFDTFATACDALHLPLPSNIDGKPVLPIYESYKIIIPNQAESRRKPGPTPTDGKPAVPVAPRKGTTWPVG